MLAGKWRNLDINHLLTTPASCSLQLYTEYGDEVREVAQQQPAEEIGP